MRVSLIFNPDAGGGTYSASDLETLLRGAGHQVRIFGKSRSDIAAALREGQDVMVVAGGDGTVAKALTGVAEARADVPLYILPAGTANNIAFALKLRDTIPVLVSRLAGSRAAPFDIGEARGPWGTIPFVEAAGIGFLAGLLRRGTSLRARMQGLVRRLTRNDLKGEAQVRAAALGAARDLERQPACFSHVVADGRALPGEYLAVEVMNVRAVGPRMVLAPDADPRDRRFDLVLVRRDDRGALAETIASGNAAGFRGEQHRVQEVELGWPPGDGHIDDEPWPARTGKRERGVEARVRISVGPTVQVLLPS